MSYEGKPQSKSVKDWLIDGMVGELSLPRETIATIIRWQGEDILEAVKKYNEIEISGWGKMLVSQNKLKRKIAKCERRIGSLEDREIEFSPYERHEKLEDWLEESRNELEYYKTKLRNE